MSLGIRMTGTVGILRLAAEKGLLDVPVMVAQLRKSGFYLSESLIHAAFGRWL
jgi:predicted nucleic acid-binding protein